MQTSAPLVNHMLQENYVVFFHQSGSTITFSETKVNQCYHIQSWHCSLHNTFRCKIIFQVDSSRTNRQWLYSFRGTEFCWWFASWGSWSSPLRRILLCLSIIDFSCTTYITFTVGMWVHTCFVWVNRVWRAVWSVVIYNWYWSNGSGTVVVYAR